MPKSFQNSKIYLGSCPLLEKRYVIPYCVDNHGLPPYIMSEHISNGIPETSTNQLADSFSESSAYQYVTPETLTSHCRESPLQAITSQYTGIGRMTLLSLSPAYCISANPEEEIRHQNSVNSRRKRESAERTHETKEGSGAYSFSAKLSNRSRSKLDAATAGRMPCGMDGLNRTPTVAS